MPTIKVMSAGAVKTMVAALGAEFERESGNTIDYNFGTAGALRDRDYRTALPKCKKLQPGRGKQTGELQAELQVHIRSRHDPHPG